jgi:hypothetical protein
MDSQAVVLCIWHIMGRRPRWNGTGLLMVKAILSGLHDNFLVLTAGVV